jgi:dienelactone hydrolase
MMEEERFSILNETDLEIKGTIFRPKKSGRFPLIVFAGGLLDTAETPYIKEMARLFLDEGYAVVRFDFTNSFGKSGGRAENITISQRARDLEQVVQYAKRRGYINDSKTGIVAYGFGAMAALVLEGFQNTAKAIVLVNTPEQIDDTAWTRFDEREMTRVRLKRYFHIQKDGQPVRINYMLFEDGYRLDIFRCARNLRTPVLYIAGAKNKIIPASQTERLFERTNCKKELDILPDLSDEFGKKQAQLLFERSFAFFKRMKVN